MQFQIAHSCLLLFFFFCLKAGLPGVWVLIEKVERVTPYTCSSAALTAFHLDLAWLSAFVFGF